jgi:phospholipase C
MTDQSSIIRFVEDNWLGGKRIGSGSFDSIAGSVTNMFDFSRHDDRGWGNDWDHDDQGVLLLNENTGEPR